MGIVVSRWLFRPPPTSWLGEVLALSATVPTPSYGRHCDQLRWTQPDFYCQRGEFWWHWSSRGVATAAVRQASMRQLLLLPSQSESGQLGHLNGLIGRQLAQRLILEDFQ